jgi:hypothetical protein
MCAKPHWGAHVQALDIHRGRVCTCRDQLLGGIQPQGIPWQSLDW